MRYESFVLLMVVCLLSLCLPNNGYCDNVAESNSAPTISTFATGPDPSGQLQNSVNLFSGDVSLPVNLVSLSGVNGLGVSVGISYSSNVQSQVDTRNLEAPTGVLGLGWNFDFDKIIVDTRNTGTYHDDTFYLVSSGTTIPLVRIGSLSDSPRKYTAKIY